jgi:hypothetical protein
VRHLTSTPYDNFDFSLMKAVSIEEMLKVQFRAEFFNVFNIQNYGLPMTTCGASSFEGYWPCQRYYSQADSVEPEICVLAMCLPYGAGQAVWISQCWPSLHSGFGFKGRMSLKSSLFNSTPRCAAS